MPKITATGVSYAGDTTDDPGEAAIVVDEHGDDAAAVADAPAAPKPAPRTKK